MGIDILGVDILGIDILGIDILALPPFEHTKHMFKLMAKETNASLGAQTILIWTYGNKQTAVTDPNSWYWC